MIESGMTTVWAHIEDELHRRRLNSAWLSRKLEASRQVVSGWKVRGVPTSRYEEIAELFGWTLDRLVNGAPEDVAAAPLAPANDPAIGYSPIAMDVARMFDEIPDELNRARAYAYVMQLSRGNVPPAAAPSTQTEPSPAAPAPPTTTKPRTAK